MPAEVHKLVSVEVHRYYLLINYELVIKLLTLKNPKNESSSVVE